MGLFGPNIEKMKKKQDLMGLKKVEYDKDSSLCSAAWLAVRELEKSGELKNASQLQATRIREYVKLLGDRGRINRALAAWLLGLMVQVHGPGKVLDAGALPGLLRAFGEEDSLVPYTARDTLARLARADTTGRMARSLVSFLGDPEKEGRTRKRVARLLLDLASEEGTESLVQALDIPALVHLLDSGDAVSGFLSGRAGQILQYLAYRKREQEVTRQLVGAIRRKAFSSTELFSTLGDVVKGNGPAILLELDGISLLVGYLERPAEELHTKALTVLMKATAEGGAQAIIQAGGLPILLRLLEDESLAVRHNAAATLASLAADGEAEAVAAAGVLPGLNQLLSAGNRDARISAARALSLLGDGEAQRLCQELEAEEEEDWGELEDSLDDILE